MAIPPVADPIRWRGATPAPVPAARCWPPSPGTPSGTRERGRRRSRARPRSPHCISLHLPQRGRVGRDFGEGQAGKVRNRVLRIRTVKSTTRLPARFFTAAAGPSHHRRVERLTLLLREPIEAGVAEDGVQPRVERMARRDREVSGRNPDRGLLALAFAHRHGSQSTFSLSLPAMNLSRTSTTGC